MHPGNVTCPECGWRLRLNLTRLTNELEGVRERMVKDNEIQPLMPDPEPATEHKTPYDRAASWAEEIRSQPLLDEQAIELAKVYATLAVADALRGVENGMKELLNHWRVGKDSSEEG